MGGRGAQLCGFGFGFGPDSGLRMLQRRAPLFSLFCRSSSPPRASSQLLDNYPERSLRRISCVSPYILRERGAKFCLDVVVTSFGQPAASSPEQDAAAPVPRESRGVDAICLRPDVIPLRASWKQLTLLPVI